MELRQLKTFIAAVEKDGFTRAGEHLGYTQGTITTHIQNLEEEIGNPLFDRIGKKVIMTEAGKNFLSYAKEIIRLSEEAVESSCINGQPSGTIRLGANESLMIYRLPFLLHEFKKTYPQVHIELQPGDNKELRYKLKSGELDLSFLLDVEKEDQDLYIYKLVRERLTMLAPPGHPLTKKQVVVPKDLQGETLLLTEPGSYRDFLEHWIKEEGVECSQIDFWNIEAIKQCVMCGLGISYLSQMSIEEELKQEKLVTLPWIHTEQSVTTQLAYHKNKWLTPAMTKLLEMIKSHVEKWGTSE
ncbi:LysR family transcriptional regulator [Peribacillus simplex]|uniref:LysR family transcriptional regulator n=1 Tax=Peribacillus simplex TaxID=1478 RepID=UPI0010BE268A|nr:LysR family transcriptional regulator [Peribacillus simplex]TKH07525.1 LysR family transcriptional regulator [Peribacillus simplex]